MNSLPVRLLVLALLCPVACSAAQTPSGVFTLAGDQSIIVQWDRNTNANVAGYRVYRSTAGPAGPFSSLISTALTAVGFCDLNASKVINGQTNYYYVTEVDTGSVESAPSVTNSATPHLFASNDEFLDYVQRATFDYFWYAGNPVNGLVPDHQGADCSIAAVGFGLTAIGIAVDHGWITRSQAVARVTTTLNTFLNGPQGAGTTGVIGYRGWFYHFLNMNTALRSGSSELSSIDTALLVAGILYARQFFNGAGADETAIRNIADAIYNRMDWNFMSQGGVGVAMGWQPVGGFSSFGNYIGYDEAMILYLLGLGAPTNPLPTSSWNYWTSGYTWGTNWGQSYVTVGPLFEYEYSHCWVDFRHIADAYMNSHNTSYFENSRRAALAQVAYCSTVPHLGYSSTVWGLTACDGPNRDGLAGYEARGLPPFSPDDGTIAPTAAGGVMPFTPEHSLPALLAFYGFHRSDWSAYGFVDAFNLGDGWYDSVELGIDEGPIVIMIENYRTQRVWNLFMQNAPIQTALQRAGFVSLPYVAVQPTVQSASNTVTLTWSAAPGSRYQVEFSPDLSTWFIVPGGDVTGTGPTASWIDTGPPATTTTLIASGQRFYRVFKYGAQ